MARKDSPRIDTSEAKRELAHNPFASLAKLAANLPAGPASTGDGGTTATAEGAAAAATAEGAAVGAAGDAKSAKRPAGRLVLRRETKHRGGKTVVVVDGADGADESLFEELAAHLKRALGCGGTVEESPSGQRIVVQGDKAARVAELLRAKGYRVGGVTG